ncbi:MAG: hypothetical protein H6836_01005 [Planctomycetes bacterium]|nr:hypothetical protein [Planctomycetota bacterium]
MTYPSDGLQAVQPLDIPVPARMSLVTHEHQSHTLEVGEGYRYADLVYEGLVPVPQIASYLTDRMQQHSYRLVSDDKPGQDHQVLVFQRGRFRSECQIRKQEYRTRLEIRVRTNL